MESKQADIGDDFIVELSLTLLLIKICLRCSKSKIVTEPFVFSHLINIHCQRVK